MNTRDIIVVFDCGATNVRAVAIDSRGKILASESYRNASSADPSLPGGRIWDVAEIWGKMCMASKKILSGLAPGRIAGVTVTTFGVDGTLFGSDGQMLHPVISWQCERSVPVMNGIEKYIPEADLYGESGVLPFHFNTIYRLLWFRENMPGLVENSHIFLFMPSIFNYFLTGKMVNDITMAGTSMLTSAGERKLSEKLLSSAGISAGSFGPLAEPGSIVGTVTDRASALTSLPEGIPVVAAGHDTQFAIFGSGAGKDEPVLSSGTWEILMVRSSRYRSGSKQLEMGITTEFDSRPGLYNIGNQWIASGITEWARRTLYPDVPGDAFSHMISAAEKVPTGSNGITVSPGFMEESGGRRGGEIKGLTLNSTRDEIYRAILEALSLRLSAAKNALEEAGGFSAESILCVGGGSKNRLWNQLRADYTGVPVRVIDHKETTVLGASLFAQAACGNAASPEEARDAISYRTETYYPSGKNKSP